MSTMHLSSERIEHASTVVAHGMNGEKSEGLIQAIHSMLTHERRAHGLVMPSGDLLAVARVFDQMVERALALGESCKDSWDGCSFDWEHYGDRMVRHTEALYTYRVFEPIG